MTIQRRRVSVLKKQRAVRTSAFRRRYRAGGERKTTTFCRTAIEMAGRVLTCLSAIALVVFALGAVFPLPAAATVQIKNNNSTFTALKDVPALFGPQIPLGGVTGVLNAALPIHGYGLADISRSVIQRIFYRTLVFEVDGILGVASNSNICRAHCLPRCILNPRILSYKASYEVASISATALCTGARR